MKKSIEYLILRRLIAQGTAEMLPLTGSQLQLLRCFPLLRLGKTLIKVHQNGDVTT